MRTGILRPLAKAPCKTSEAGISSSWDGGACAVSKNSTLNTRLCSARARNETCANYLSFRPPLKLMPHGTTQVETRSGNIFTSTDGSPSEKDTYIFVDFYGWEILFQCSLDRLDCWLPVRHDTKALRRECQYIPRLGP